MNGLVGPLADESPALELAFAHALVQRAGRGEIDEVVRIYCPSRPMVVFGRRDTRLPGFPRALGASREAGFDVAVRATGGRAVAYTQEAIVIDHVKREGNPAEGQERRFQSMGFTFVEVLRELGVEAGLGAVPGEYCPGAHSVNARGTVKLIGTAQRVIRNAWLFSSLVIVDNAALLRPLLATVYGALGLPFEESSVGAVGDEADEVAVHEVEHALINALAPGVTTRPTSADDSTMAVARELLSQHQVRGPFAVPGARL